MVKKFDVSFRLLKFVHYTFFLIQDYFSDDMVAKKSLMDWLVFRLLLADFAEVMLNFFQVAAELVCLGTVIQIGCFSIQIWLFHCGILWAVCEITC